MASRVPGVASAGTSYGSIPNKRFASMPLTSSGVPLPLKFDSPSPPGKSLHLNVKVRIGQRLENSVDVRRRETFDEVHVLGTEVSTAERE